MPELRKMKDVPICQDTGFAVVFIELGQDVHLFGGDLKEAVFEGVRQGYRDGYLQKVDLPSLHAERILEIIRLQ